jgi:two-component system nitrate/nitrite response regulator NarL
VNAAKGYDLNLTGNLEFPSISYEHGVYIMGKKIKIAILDDHQGIIDGYMYRLSSDPDIEVVATMTYGEELDRILEEHYVDVLLLDVQVPTNASNANTYPILHSIPKILQTYPNLSVLVISMYNQRTLIQSVMEAGASGYILKDDQNSIQDLATIIRGIASGGIHLSQKAYAQLMKRQKPEDQVLTSRQLEALSLCASYPNDNIHDLASRMNIANSTMRNLLSSAYIRLKVQRRGAAVAKARQMNLITPDKSAHPL